MKRVIHWFRRDLRISDNTALYYACSQADEVIPCYVLSTWKRNHQWTGPNRQEFLCGCLESLAKNLEQRKPEPLAKVGHLRTPGGLISKPVPTLDHWGLQSEANILQAGEKAARDRLKTFFRAAVGSADSSSRRWGDFRAGCDDAARAPGSDRTSEMTTEPKDGLPNRQGSEKEPLMKIDSIYWENSYDILNAMFPGEFRREDRFKLNKPETPSTTYPKPQLISAYRSVNSVISSATEG